MSFETVKINDLKFNAPQGSQNARFLRGLRKDYDATRLLALSRMSDEELISEAQTSDNPMVRLLARRLDKCLNQD
jgi:hypothetical protein